MGVASAPGQATAQKGSRSANPIESQAVNPASDADQRDPSQGVNRLSAEQMRRDLNYLVDKINQVHPATVKELPAELATAIETARGRITPSLDPVKFWAVLCEVITSLHDGHSSLRTTPADERIDLPFKWLKEGLIVDKDTKQLAKGDRIVSIGGCSDAELLTRLRSLVSAENNPSIKARAAGLLPQVAVLNALDIATGLNVEVEVERAGKHKTLAISSGTRPMDAEAKLPWVRWEIDSTHRLGVLTLDECTFDELYRRTLQEFFAAVQQSEVTRIAVDVRENGGGDSRVVSEFLRYLDVPDYRDYSAEIRFSPDAISQRKYPAKPGYQRFISTASKPNPPPELEDFTRFTGKVYILTSTKTYSSANWLAVICQDNGIAEVVGDRTGNAPTSYGDVLFFTLPESGWVFTLSHKKFIRPDPENDPADALLPDKEIPFTRSDIQTGRDPVLDYLRNQVDG
jgi:C-terminal processing protease CtpA/Prc